MIQAFSFRFCFNFFSYQEIKLLWIYNRKLILMYSHFFYQNRNGKPEKLLTKFKIIKNK